MLYTYSFYREEVEEAGSYNDGLRFRVCNRRKKGVLNACCVRTHYIPRRTWVASYWLFSLPGRRPTEEPRGSSSDGVRMAHCFMYVLKW